MIGLLETIEPLVGDADQEIRLIAILGKGGHAVVHSDQKRQLKRTESLRKNDFNTTAECEGLGRVGLRQKQGKFVAADAKRGVGGAKSFLQRGGGGAENFVAAGVAILIVNFLEAMKIHDHDA